MHGIEKRYGRFTYDLFRIHQYHVRELVNPKNKEHEARLNWIIDRASTGICHVLEFRNSRVTKGSREK